MPRRMRSLFRNLLRGQKVDQALDDELRSSVELLTDEKMEEGYPQSAARRAALIELGGVDQVKEEVRAIRVGHLLEDFARDLRFAFRTLAKSPGFTAVTVITLALGIGANTAFFGVLNTTLFRPLPYLQPEQLVHINERVIKSNEAMPVSYPNFIDWKQQQTTFSALAIYRTDSSVNLTIGARTDREPTVLVDHDFLKTLGFQVARGRDFTPDDDRIGAPLAVLISDATWSGRFNSDPGVVGCAVRVDGKPATIVGILPPTFQFFRNSKLILPLGPFVERMYMQMRDEHGNAMVLGRLRSGLSLKSAKEEMDSIAARLAEQYPKTNSGVGVTLMSLRQYLVGDARERQLLLMSAVGLVLLIACVNVATLSLARARAREREMAVRAALGAGRSRLIRQLLAECLLLSGIGGGLGLFLAIGLSATLDSLVPFRILQLNSAGTSTVDFRVGAFALAVTLLTGLGFGLAPAWQASNTSPIDALKDRDAAGRTSLGRIRTSDLLVVAQVGLATLIVVAAGLVLRSLWLLSAEPLGYQLENVLSLRLASPSARFGGSLPRIGAFYTEAAERLAQLPGVEAAAVTSNLPFGYTDSYMEFRLLDRPVPAPGEYPSTQRRIVSRDYFPVLGIPLQQGRCFNGQEPMLSFSSDAPKLEEMVTALRKLPFEGVVTRSFAQRYWPGENPIGKRLLLGSPNVEIAVVTVVGVVGDTSQDSLGQTNHEEFYLSLRQFPAPVEYSLILRTRGNPSALVEAAKAELQRMTATEPVYDVRPLASRVAESVSTRSFQTQLISWFAGLALLLASVGLYGLLAFNVGRRSREIGIRIALGAAPKSVVENVFFRGFSLVIPGLAMGLLGAWGVGRYLQSQLYRVSATDPLTYAFAALALLFSAFLACLLPARRAAKVDPMMALRRE